jgi:hypothetical protein
MKSLLGWKGLLSTETHHVFFRSSSKFLFKRGNKMTGGTVADF